MSFTLCVTSTFDLDDSDSEEDNRNNSSMVGGNKINDTLTIPMLPEGGGAGDQQQYRPNPIEKGGKMQFDIIREEESVKSDKAPAAEKSTTKKRKSVTKNRSS